MMNRAINDLCQLKDDKLFQEISIGMGHILEVVKRLGRSASRLPGYKKVHTKSLHSHAVHLLGALAEEEAAKFFILLDFVRCPRSQQKSRSRQLGYFYDHLAKGIYAEICSRHFVDFADVARFVNSRRKAFYLDGPMDVDWIFSNNILSRREDRFYVNYVKDGDDNYYWQYPRTTDFEIGYHTGTVIEIARALDAVDLASPKGLAIVAEIWRTVEVKPELTHHEISMLNRQTLKHLQEKGLSRDTPCETFDFIEQRWSFPLYSLDLSLDPPTHDRKAQKKRIKELRDIQERWTPDDY
ncbi:MAG TPA: hypothetical protein ENH05_03615 [Rhizobiales bacterium]|nr:hypothetical protein [Hyphomicrobiales bacterium]